MSTSTIEAAPVADTETEPTPPGPSDYSHLIPPEMLDRYRLTRALPFAICGYRFHPADEANDLRVPRCPTCLDLQPLWVQIL